MSDRVSALQIKLSNTENCAYSIKKTPSEFKNCVSMKVKRNEISCKCLPIPKVTIKCEFISYPKHIISIINVYVPITNLSEIMFLYSRMSAVMSALLFSNHSYFQFTRTIYQLGNGTPNKGKKIKQHTSDNYIGSYAGVVRNDNGQYLTDFLAINNIFISHTAF